MSHPFGIHTDIPNEQYHALNELDGAHCVSSSYIKQWINKSPLHAERGGFSLTQSVADIGTAVHSMALEPERGDVIRGADTRRGKEWKDAYTTAQASGKTLLTAGDYDECEAMTQSLMDNAQCGKILQDKTRLCEASLFVKHEPSGLVIKARPDIWVAHSGVMGDVKTCQDASPKGFTRSAFNLGYDLQSAVYRLAARLAGWNVRYFAFLAVEKSSPYCAHLHTFGNEANARADRIVEAALMEIAEAKDKQEFTTRWGPFNVMHLPPWLEQQD